MKLRTHNKSFRVPPMSNYSPSVKPELIGTDLSLSEAVIRHFRAEILLISFLLDMRTTRKIERVYSEECN